MTLRRSVPVLTVLAAATLTAFPAGAAFLERPVNPEIGGRYSNYDPEGILTLQRTANSFVPGSDVVLDEIRWSGYFDDGGLHLTAPFRVRLYDDRAGLPGGVLAEVELEAEGTDTGMETFGKPVLEYVAGPGLQIQLPAGSVVWLSVAHALFPQFLWSRATTADGGTAWANSDDGGWQVWGGEDCAFVLTESASTPARPTSWSRIKAIFATR